MYFCGCFSERVAECLRYPNSPPPGARWRLYLLLWPGALIKLLLPLLLPLSVAVCHVLTLGHSRTQSGWNPRQAVAESHLAAAPRYRTRTTAELDIIRSSSSVRRTNSFSCSIRRRFRPGAPVGDRSTGRTENRDYRCPAG